jgi:cold shock CspA family protein
MKTGEVVSFDEAVGLGTVRADDGCVLPFHCTAIAGGTRTIEVGTRVVFDVTAGGRGQWEASPLVALG